MNMGKRPYIWIFESFDKFLPKNEYAAIIHLGARRDRHMRWESFLHNEIYLFFFNPFAAYLEFRHLLRHVRYWRLNMSCEIAITSFFCVQETTSKPQQTKLQ